jgi:hypothetical protein
MLLLTNTAILVFFTGTMQQQHGFSSIEEETGNKNNNNPPGFKSIKNSIAMVNSLPVGVLKELVMVSFGFHMTLLLILQIMCM